MKIEKETRIVQPNYKIIRELSHHMDCTITEEDFNMECPNPNRINCIIEDIHRHLKYTGGKLR